MLRIAGLVLIVLVCVDASWDQGYWKSSNRRFYYEDDFKKLCTQEEADCEECINKSKYCHWCYSDYSGFSGGQCKLADDCRPTQGQATRSCNPPTPPPREISYKQTDNDNTELAERELEMLTSVSDESSKTENASFFCAVSKNCSTCVEQDFCFWCDQSQRCYSYGNVSMTNHICPEKKWYRNQCRYEALTKPCPLRNASCDDCLSYGKCFWCSSTQQCSYYPYKGYTPPDCPKDNVQIESCKGRGFLFIVLLPILCIIFIPIIIYLIIWLVLLCMKQAGYDPLKPEDEEPKRTPKEKKPIKLQHEPAPSKTNELRKKYGLQNGEDP